jgi:probable selenium-dependent hydroxylase accessory protein YqeC
LALLSAWFEEFIFGPASETRPDNYQEGNSAQENSACSRVITFIGSGGKTSLIWLLARSLAQSGFQQVRETGSGTIRRKVLVTPSTRMYIPGGGFFDRYCNGIPEYPVAGISLAGRFNEKTGKLESLPLEALEGIIGDYDVVLIEGDGSRELPLKAWAEYEPVVPLFTGITVGVIPIKPLGMPVTEKIIHRLPQFCALSGAKPGDILTSAHFAAVIGGHSRSLFSAARGEKALFFNQAESAGAINQCLDVVRLLTPEFRQSVCKIFAGSAEQNVIQEIGYGYL